MTPPKGSMSTSGIAWAARTIDSEVGVAPGNAKTPKASAIGATPLPTLLIARDQKSLRNSTFRSTALLPSMRGA
jgi:hypothetical protein